jgi:hypothetical protein
MAQLYTNDLSFTKVYPMKTKAEAANTLSKFIHDMGIPNSLHSDDAPELMHGQLKQICKEYDINTTYTEPYSPWQNRAEGSIRELKRHIYRMMTSKGVPQRLWDFCAKWVCKVRKKTVGNIPVLEDRTPYEAMLGDTPEISSLIPFDFYDPIWYFDETSSFPEPKRKTGRWIGEAQDFGQAMCYWIISETGKPIVRSTVQPIPLEHLVLPAVQDSIKSLDTTILDKLGAPMSDSHEGYDFDILLEEGHITPEFEPFDPEHTMPEADEWDAEAYDQYIAAEVCLPKDGREVLGQVTSRKHDQDGNPIGRANANPIMDTRIYQVTFPDGDTAEYSANVIAECLYSQVDNEGNQYLLLDSIIDHKRTKEAVDDSEILQISHNGNLHPRRTTKGWKFCILWKDGSTS